MFRRAYDATGGVDGRVSIEVDPRLAHDTDGHHRRGPGSCGRLVDRPNVLIKIPATQEGLPAITAVLAEGISVNVTLIFSPRALPRRSWTPTSTGLEQAAANGQDLAEHRTRWRRFFVSRVDTEIDKRLDEDRHRRGRWRCGARPAIANARLAYEAYEEVFAGDRWAALAAAGAKPQRPLWASTGVKDPAYADTLYVDRAGRADTVNTMPEATLDAVADHGEITGDTVDRHLRRRPSAVFDAAGGASASTSTTSSRCSRTRASRSSRRPGTSCSTRSPTR